MSEAILALEPNKAFEGLRMLCLAEGCKIVQEKPPEKLVVEQGRLLFVFSPRHLKKKIVFDFIPHDSRMRVASKTSSLLWLHLAVDAGFYIPVTLILWLIISDLTVLSFLIGLIVVGLIIDMSKDFRSYNRREVVAERLLKLLAQRSA